MVLILRGYRVMKAPSGKKRLQQYIIYHKWTDKDLDELEFDYLSALEWKKFLKTFKTTNNKLLPRVSNDGEEIRWQVYFWGCKTWIKEHFNREGRRDGFICVFPGYNSKNEPLDLIEYGKID